MHVPEAAHPLTQALLAPYIISQNHILTSNLIEESIIHAFRGSLCGRLSDSSTR